MIFFSKRDNGPRQSPNTEACVSITGLILVIGLIGGLAALIYGLVTKNSSATIIGGIVLGVSTLFSIILALVFVYCLKNNNVDSNVNEQRSSSNQRQHKQNRHHQQNRQVQHQQRSSYEINVISGIQKSDNHHPQRQSNGYDGKHFSPPIQNSGLANSNNVGYGKQMTQSSIKTSSSGFLNQSNGSINNQNQQSLINANTIRNNYNRH